MLQSLTNVVLEKKVPQTYFLQIEFEVSIGNKVQMIEILLQALSTRDEDVDATLRQFDLISLNINELMMHMVTIL